MIEFIKMPQRCPMCNLKACRDDLPVCKDCLYRLNGIITAKCEKCRKSVFECDCRKSDDFKSLFFYANKFETHSLIFYIKSVIDERFMDFIAELLFCSNNINPKNYDAVTFVPRKPRRKRIYGNDQAEQIAKAIERKFGIPLIYALERIGGREQKTLSAKERFLNTKGRYRLRCDLPDEKYNRILLVDDICTTGVTVKRCAELLREGLSRQVGIMIIARK